MPNRCDRAGCPGVIAGTGFCDTCGRRPLRQPAGPGRLSPPPAARRTPRHRAAEWTDLPVFDLPPAADRLLPEVAYRSVSSQRCWNCGAVVGEDHADQGTLAEGFCGQCGKPFSYAPKLAAGEVVDGRYAIDGCLARGGLGWVYLARDTRVDRLVVLKGLVNSADPGLVEAAVREREWLRDFDHPGIVDIVDVVSGPVPGSGELTAYIVMRHVDGLSLQQVIDEAAGDRALVHLEQVVNCGLQILEALRYLHERGVLYCDMKPDNVMLTAGGAGRDPVRIKLVDLGAVRRADDRTTRLVTTRSFVPAEDERPSVPFDLYQVGATLAALAESTAESGPGGETAVESFELLIERACRREPERRFGSAAEMAGQLAGVRRQLAAVRTGEQQPAPSALFAPPAVLLDGGLGRPPELDRWICDRPAGDRDGRAEALVDGASPAGRPVPADVPAALPAPRIERSDPAAAQLARLEAPDPRWLVEQLDERRAEAPRSAEVEWLACRAYVELGLLAEARDCRDRARALVAGWRAAWHTGLISLAAGDVAAARQEFDRVRAELPGEPAPLLALGCCAELLDELDKAQRCYDAVWQRDRGETGAAFGRARVALARADRARAVQVLDEVPLLSRHADAARVAAFRARCVPVRGGSELPTETDVDDAEERLRRLRLDEASGQRLRTALAEVVLARTRGGGRESERRARTALEQSLRGLARQARDAEEHGVLLDRANSVRPRTWW